MGGQGDGLGIIEKLRPAVARAKRRYEIWRLAGLHRYRLSRLPGGAKLDETTRREALVFVDSLVGGYRDLGWHEFYASSNGRASPYYLPSDIFYALVLPVMNPASRVTILQDKNHFDLISAWPPLPTTVGRLMDGRLLDRHFAPTTLAEIVRQAPVDALLVVKPSRITGSGKGLALVTPKALGAELEVRTDAIIQMPIVQHPDLAALNPSSVNTIRFISYRTLAGDILPLAAMLRIGRAGQAVDNTGAGGLFCGIADDGTLQPVGYDIKHRRYQAHPDSGIRLAGHRIPGFAAVRAALLEAHRRTPWIDFGTWDAAIDTSGQPVMVEVNVGTTIRGPQVAHGPIFEPVLDDIRRRIGKRRYSRLAGFL